MPKITRRDFISMGAGAALGYGFFTAAHWKRLADDGPRINRRRAAFLNHNQPALANPHGQLGERYDVAVIGSGYGGSILAARLAAPGRKLCVLERGREWVAGDFPDNMLGLPGAARVPLNPLGLFDANIQLDNDMDIMVACGLGGGSLINGAIGMRPEKPVFAEKEWPKELRTDGTVDPLDFYFTSVEKMLGTEAQPNPTRFGVVAAHQRILEKKGVAFGAPPLNIAYKLPNGRINRFGALQHACINCGDCVTGCNVGAKNTLAMNYLPYAKSTGAEIYVGIEARTIEKAVDGGYVVNYVYHPGGMGLPIEGKLIAKTLILAAGCMGSTEILLRSQVDGFRFSDALGSRFSANADIVGLGYNGDARTDVLAYGAEGREQGPPVGPTIASYGDYRTGNRPLEERFLLFAGTIPSAMIESTSRALGAYGLLNRDQLTQDQLARIKADLESVTTGQDGALARSTLYLACGHDTGDGKFELPDNAPRVRVRWPGSGRQRCFEAITAEMADCAKRSGALFVQDPHATVFGDQRQLTVHPLGGCPMGDDARSGVVDHRGCVFDADGGFHEGLYVADGSIVPRSLGVPPLLTISALAERIADLFPKG